MINFFLRLYQKNQTSQGQACTHANAPSVSVVSIIVLSASLWEHPKHVQAGNNLRLNQRLFPLAVHHRQVKGTANEIPTRTAGAMQAKIKAHVHTHTLSHAQGPDVQSKQDDGRQLVLQKLCIMVSINIRIKQPFYVQFHSDISG